MPVEQEEIRRLVRVEVNEMIRSGGLPVSAVRVPRAMVTLAADVVVNNNTTVTLAWTGPHLYDHFGVHSQTTNPDRLVCPDGGTYAMISSLCWDADANGVRQTFTLLNGSVVGRHGINAHSTIAMGYLAMVVRKVSKGAFFQVQARNQGGGAGKLVLGGVPGAQSSWATLVRLA